MARDRTGNKNRSHEVESHSEGENAPIFPASEKTWIIATWSALDPTITLTAGNYPDREAAIAGIPLEAEHAAIIPLRMERVK